MSYWQYSGLVEYFPSNGESYGKEIRKLGLDGGVQGLYELLSILAYQGAIRRGRRGFSGVLQYSP